MATTKKQPVKKTAALKTQQKAEVPAWKTIHVFGHGKTQVIGPNHNGIVASSELKTLAPLFTSLAEKQQKGTKVSPDGLHALNIYNGFFIDFFPATAKNKHQRFAWSEIETEQVEKLGKELMSMVPEQKEKRNFMTGLRQNNAAILRRKNIADPAKKNNPASKKATV